MDSSTAANGPHTHNGTPRGFSALTPHLVVSPAKEAIAFYQQVLGATLDSVTEAGGQVVHAQLDLGNGKFTLSDPVEAYGLKAPSPGEPITYSLGVYVPDVDAAVQRAVAAGATLREEVATFVSGDRFGSITDPFGVRWSVMTRVIDLSSEESARRVEEWAKSAF